MRRQKALEIYYKLHVDSPYLTRDRERQYALADYTGKNTTQVIGVFVEDFTNLPTCIQRRSVVGKTCSCKPWPGCCMRLDGAHGCCYMSHLAV